MAYDEAFYLPPKSKSEHQGFVRKGEQRNRPRAPQPGQGSIRVENGDQATWLPSDPRSRPTPAPSRFASVIEEARAEATRPPPSDPLFRRDAERVRRDAAGMDVLPPRRNPREATPYSAGSGEPGLASRRVATPYSATGGPGLATYADKMTRMLGEYRGRPPEAPGSGLAEDADAQVAALVGRFRQAAQDAQAAELYNARPRTPDRRPQVLRGETPFQTGRGDPLEQLRPKPLTIPQGGFAPVPYAAPTSPEGASFLGEPQQPVSPIGETELGPSAQDWREAEAQRALRAWVEAGAPAGPTRSVRDDDAYRGYFPRRR